MSLIRSSVGAVQVDGEEARASMSATFGQSIRRVLSLLAIMVTLTFFSALPAGAHAVVEGTTPTNNQTIQQAPEFVEVTFNETVITEKDSLKVFDSRTRRIDTGSTRVLDNRRVQVDVGRLAPGGYVMTWRVVSADGHPLRGASTFQMQSGNSDETNALAARLFQADGGSLAVGIAYSALRAISFGGLVVALGLLFFMGIRRVQDPRLKRIALGALLALAVASLLEIPAMGADARGTGLASMVSPETWKVAFEAGFGWWQLARAVTAAVVFAWLIRAKSDLVLSKQHPVVAAGLVAATVALVATALARHAVTGRYPALGFALDVIHVAASSVWIGGLLALVVSVLRVRRKEGLGSTDSEVSEELATLHRFSTLATVCVVLVAVSGVLQGWRQVGSFDGLFSSSYGVLLAVKALLFALMIAAAQFGRTRIRYELNEVRTTEPRRSLRLQTGFEVIAALAIICITALLVNASPPQTAGAGGVGFSKEVNLKGYIAQVTVDPARAGMNEVHVYTLNESGAPTAVEDVKLRIALPDQGIEYIDIPLQRLAADHYASYNFTIPIAANWKAALGVRTSETAAETASLEIPIGK